MIDVQIPPGKYFISHSYRDANVRDKMIERLPRGVEPFVFPPINVSPTEFVSNPLILAILACDAVIVLRRGFSEKSYWVAFERDYALRAGKPVYSYDPLRMVFSRIDPKIQSPLKLPIYPHTMADNYIRDRKEVNEINSKQLSILSFMAKERYFHILGMTPGSPVDFGGGVDGILNRGGYIIQFLSKLYNTIDIQRCESLNSDNAARRTMIALMEDADLPSWSQPELVIRLYQEENRQVINFNRVDDLIVRLYWMIFRNQFPELVYE